MSDLRSRLTEAVREIAPAYHRLVLLVGSIATGKSQLLKRLAEDNAWPIIDLNAELSRRLLDVPQRRRPFVAQEEANGLVAAISDVDGDPVILDGTQILFQKELQLDPLKLLKGLSRDRTVLAEWLGEFSDDVLTYAQPEHPEYRKYRKPGISVVSMDK